MSPASGISGYTRAALVAGLVVALLWWLRPAGEIARPQLSTPAVEDSPATGSTPSREKIAPAGPTRSAVAPVVADSAAVSVSEEVGILGHKLALRELRDTDGRVRNLEFVFRRGVRPRPLFAGNRQWVIDYRPLHRNSVGYGAATTYFLYQLVREDSNTDGQLSAGDRVELAVSRPDGSDFRVLDRDLGQVVEIEHFPSRNRVRLKMVTDGAHIEREYALPD